MPATATVRKPRATAMAAPRAHVAGRAAAPPGRASRVADAYHAIRRRILDNVYPPGHQALEGALAAELGISRTPVREALIRLAHEGLVEVVPRHGMRVLPVSPDDMREIYAVLAALESAAAEALALRRPSDAELQPLVDAIARLADRVHRARMFTLRLRPKPVNSTHEHTALLERIRAGDAPGAVDVNRAHRARATRELVTIFERYRLQQL